VAGPILSPDLDRFFEDVEMDNNWEQISSFSTVLQHQNPPRGDGGVEAVRRGSAPVRGGLNEGGGAIEDVPSSGRQHGTRINKLNFVSTLFQRFRLCPR